MEAFFADDFLFLLRLFIRLIANFFSPLNVAFSVFVDSFSLHRNIVVHQACELMQCALRIRFLITWELLADSRPLCLSETFEVIL